MSLPFSHRLVQSSNFARSDSFLFAESVYSIILHEKGNSNSIDLTGILSILAKHRPSNLDLSNGQKLRRYKGRVYRALRCLLSDGCITSQKIGKIVYYCEKKS